MKRVTHFAFTLSFLLTISFGAVIHAGIAAAGPDEPKVSAPGVYEGYTEPQYKKFEYSSSYLTMRDGAEIAVDLVLPKGLEEGAKIPTIIYLTRYVRTLEAKWPFRWLKDPVFGQIPEEEVAFFTSYGYAVVIVDVRGSGASPGRRVMEFTEKEIKDGAEVVDWIIQQPWSNGNVGSTGVSYLGTTAELLLVNQHPAVKASIPRHNIFDLYNHIVFPGGVRQGPFIKVWAKTTNALDNSEFGIFGKRPKRLVKGTNPVDGDKGRKKLKAAVESHEDNFDVFSEMFKVTYRDDLHPELNRSLDSFSIHTKKDIIENSGTAIYRIGGWYDGALMNSALMGWLSTDNTEKVLIGPWDHGPHNSASPFVEDREVKFDVNMEMLRFWDYHLKGIDNKVNDGPELYYYTVGAEKWRSANTWPLPEQQMQTFYFSEGNHLVKDEQQRQDGKFNYQIDFTHTTGTSTRWNSLTAIYRDGDTRYPDRRKESAKCLNFTFAPFEENVEMTGHPVIDLYMSADATDATVFVYIEDVAPNGVVNYVTEGQFRAIHRKVSDKLPPYVQPGPYHTFKREDAMPLVPGEVARLTFDILPISYEFRKGHSLRVSIAGADIDHFDQPEDRPSKFEVYFTPDYPSSIEIPLVEREDEGHTAR